MGISQNDSSLMRIELYLSTFVVMYRLEMADSVSVASDFVEQGHVRVGTELVTDPAFLVTRNMEDTVTWTNSSKIRAHVLNYNNERDDFLL
uniref:U3 small nucleolar ribonucleoprotein protein IMP3 n=1 Tax=Ascaris lumbricoides TaxID=6252 RepID=A0A0M3I5N3_ASCLU